MPLGLVKSPCIAIPIGMGVAGGVVLYSGAMIGMDPEMGLTDAMWPTLWPRVGV